MNELASCVALLADQVDSRHADRDLTHNAILAAIIATNAEIPALDALRVTVGDELQGVYATLGEALAAEFCLRDQLVGVADLRFGLGGGEVRVIDRERGIQDGSAWWRAREAIDAAESLASEPGFTGLRTGLVDGRGDENPLVLPLIRMVDAQLARLRDGAREALASHRAGLDNQTAAERAGISPSANSQRINNNDLRILADAMAALQRLP